jgi:hypothetical protein
MALQDFNINIKLKLAALWTSVTLCYLYGDYFELYVPEKTKGLITGDNLLNSPFNLFLAAFALSVPAVMVCASLLLKPAINKWLNIIFGSFFTLVMLLIAVTSLVTWREFYVYLALVESVLTILIVWYAVKWPKE